MQFKIIKKALEKFENSHNNSILTNIKNKRKENNKMEVKIVCDRCFENIEMPGTVYRKGYDVGSCTYCEKCYNKIQEEFRQENIARLEKISLEEIEKAQENFLNVINNSQVKTRRFA